MRRLAIARIEGPRPALILIFALLAGCGHRSAPRHPGLHGTVGDAPYEIASDEDLSALRDRFLAMRLDDPTRPAARRVLATEYDHRVTAALESGDRLRAFRSFKRLLELWDGRELRRGAPELAAHAAVARRVLSEFSTSGSDIESATALYALIEAEPAAAAKHLAELELIFSYSDELAVAEHGEGAERSRPIAILEAVVEVFPCPAAVSRLDRLYRGRQKAIDRLAREGKLTYELIGAHGQGVIRTAWHLVRIWALGGDVAGAAAGLSHLAGIGEDPELTAALLGAASRDATPTQWIALVDKLAAGGGDDDDDADPNAALAAALQGVDRFPNSPEMRRTAGLLASRADRVLLAVRLLEKGVSAPLSDRPAAKELGELYEFRVAQLAFANRPGAAAQVLSTFEHFYSTASGRWPDFKPDLANAYASMGRGLISLGELAQARTFLERSLAVRPTLEGLEQLGILALRRDQFEKAATYFERALTLPAPNPNVRFDHNRLMRLAGEANAGAGHQSRAIGHYLRALAAWERMRSSKTTTLKPPFAAEAFIETGKLLWNLGKRDAALQAFAAAEDVDPDNGSTYAGVVSFLIVRDRYAACLDAYHRALGSHEVSDYFKIYMSLWILAEARRAHHPLDSLAQRYLAGRNGRLWADELARYASGRASLKALEKAANTRGRRAELLYYRAVLGGSSNNPARVRALLRQVVASDMVTFFEYDMAKHWLAAAP